MKVLQIGLCIFLYTFSTSLAVPVDHHNGDSDQVKHEKAMAIANRLLKQLTSEHKDKVLYRPSIEVEQDEDSDEDVGVHHSDDDLPFDFNDILPLLDQPLFDDIIDQEDFEKDLARVIQKQMMDDRMMNAEDH